MGKQNKQILQRPFIYLFVFCTAMGPFIAGMYYSDETLLPIQLKELVGGNKEVAIAVIGALSTIFMSMCGLITGIIVDKTGQQLPIILLSCILLSIAVICRTVLEGKWWMVFLHGVLVIVGKGCTGAITTSYNSLIAKTFPKSQLGAVGGFSGFFLLLGGLVGVSIIGYFFDSLPRLIWSSVAAALLILTFIILASSRIIDKAFLIYKARSKTPQPFDEEEDDILTDNLSIDEDLYDSIIGDVDRIDDLEDSKLYSTPGEKHNIFAKLHKYLRTAWKNVKEFAKRYYLFGLMIAVSFFTTFGAMISMQYMLYFLEEAIGDQDDYHIIIPWINDRITNAMQARALYGAVLLVTSLFAALSFGIFSDLVKKKIIFGIFCNIIFPLCKITIGVTLNMNVILIISVFQGFVTGLYRCVEVTMMNELLPNPKHSGRDVAIFAFFQTVSAVIATLTGGLLLQLSNLIFHQTLYGYYLIFSFGTISHIVGLFLTIVIFICQIQGTRKPKSIKTTSLNDTVYDQF